MHPHSKRATEIRKRGGGIDNVQIIYRQSCKFHRRCALGDAVDRGCSLAFCSGTTNLELCKPEIEISISHLYRLTCMQCVCEPMCDIARATLPILSVVKSCIYAIGLIITTLTMSRVHCVKLLSLLHSFNLTEREQNGEDSVEHMCVLTVSESNNSEAATERPVLHRRRRCHAPCGLHTLKGPSRIWRDPDVSS